MIDHEWTLDPLSSLLGHGLSANFSGGATNLAALTDRAFLSPGRVLCFHYLLIIALNMVLKRSLHVSQPILFATDWMGGASIPSRASVSGGKPLAPPFL